MIHLYLFQWYDSCQSAPGSLSYDFFCREWPDAPLMDKIGLDTIDVGKQQGTKS